MTMHHWRICFIFILTATPFFYLQGQPAIPKFSGQPSSKPVQKQILKQPGRSVGSGTAAVTVSVKFLSNADGILYIDGQSKGTVQSQTPLKLKLEPGAYALKVIGTSHPDDIVKGTLALSSTDLTEKLYEINLLEAVSKRMEAERLFAQADQFYFGIDVTQDVKKGVRFYEEAAKMGNTNAMITLSYMYAEGIGFEMDLASSNQWYIKLIEQLNNGASVSSTSVSGSDKFVRSENELRQSLYAQMHAKFKKNDGISVRTVGSSRSQFYRIRNVGTNNYLNIESGILLCSPTGDDSWSSLWCPQQVNIENSVNEKSYVIANRWKHVFLYADANKSVDAAFVTAAKASVVWVFESIPGTDYYRIRNKNTSDYLHISGKDISCGTLKSDNVSYVWSIEPFERSVTRATSSYIIPVNNRSGAKEALTVQHSKIDYRSSIVLTPFQAGDGQKFHYDPGTGYIHAVERSQFVLDVTNHDGQTYKANDVILWSMNNGDNQKWDLERVQGDDTKFYIRSRLNNRYLTTTTMERSSGLVLMVKEKSDDTLMWRFERN